MLRLYGKEGLQKHIRESIHLAQKMEQLVQSDDSFEMILPAVMGLVCFRMKVIRLVKEILYYLNVFFFFASENVINPIAGRQRVD